MRLRRTRPLGLGFAGVLLVGLLIRTLLAQQLPPPLIPESGQSGGHLMRVEVRLVMVDAMLRDRRGRALDGLQAQDFLLLEDGVPQEIRHFSRNELPLAVALVVDRSESIHRHLHRLRDAAAKVLRELKAGDQVALFAFANSVERLVDLTTDRDLITDNLKGIQAAGGTNIHDALFAATYYLAMTAPDYRRVVILISDNTGTVKGYANREETLRLALQTETVIYSIVPSRPWSSWYLKMPKSKQPDYSAFEITRRSGGQVLNLQQIWSLRKALSEVIAQLKLRYTLGYQSSNKSCGDAFRQIEFQLADSFGRRGKDYTVQARRGYYVPCP